VQVVLKNNPALAARWIMLRDRLQDEVPKVAEFVFWKFVAEGFAPAYKKMYQAMPLVDYGRVQEILQTFVDRHDEAHLPIRPYGQKPDDALIRSDIVIFRRSKNDYVVAFYRDRKGGGRELYGVQLDSQDAAFKEAARIRNLAKKPIVYITRRGQRRALT
jgi:hypothetical protein